MSIISWSGGAAAGSVDGCNRIYSLISEQISRDIIAIKVLVEPCERSRFIEYAQKVKTAVL
jgi:hypothetical protein